MTAAADVIAAARRYLGVPFRAGGRDASGLDCAGLAIAVARDLGIAAPFERAGYTLPPPPGLLTQVLAEYAVPVSDPLPGGLLQISVAGRAQHLAVVGSRHYGEAEELTLIHADESVRRVVEHRLAGRWLRRIASCWRLPGVL